jgi:FkbM family methyltransferase
LTSRLDSVVRALARGYGSLPIRPAGGQLQRLLLRYARRHDRRTLVTEVGGIRYALDLDELIDVNLYYRGSHEHRATATVRSVVVPGMVALDIGANLGYYTLTLASLVGESGRVIAFEPTERALRRLTTNLGLNAFDHIVVEKIALSDVTHDREVDPQETAFRASWRVGGERSGREREVISFERLDDYVARSHLDRVDFVKVDVDGYELRVVLGGEETFRRHRPALFIEIGKASMEEIGDDPLELACRLWELGYGFESDDRTRTFGSPEELIASIRPDESAMILCCPRMAAGDAARGN